MHEVTRDRYKVSRRFGFSNSYTFTTVPELEKDPKGNNTTTPGRLDLQNSQELCEMRTELQIMMLNKISQIQKDKYCMFPLICGS